MSSVIDPLSDDINLSDYAKRLSFEAMRRYCAKLLYNDNHKHLPDPYLIRTSLTDDPSKWPDIGFGDIYCYLIETPGVFTSGSMKAYKSLDAYRKVRFYSN